MGSRFAHVPHFDFCFSPVRISKNGRVIYVPCGKCAGCLLQKSNSWSFRLGDEIEHTPFSIFSTLTYDNVHVPKLRCVVEDGQFHWFSAADNFRAFPLYDKRGKYIGYRDKLRDFMDFYSPYHLNAPLFHYDDSRVIGYLCKSDIQLFLKLLRKRVYESLNVSRNAFRYYIVGEYGPGKDPDKGKYRPHYHAIFLPSSEEVASFLLQSALFESWSMCNRQLFEQYTKYCDSGTRHYVTEYVTSVTSLPQLLQQEKEIRPFFLSSKKVGALGTSHFDRKKVSEDIERGIDEYIKRVPRIERNYLFFYPPTLTSSLFPKCSGFSLLSFDGLLRIYEFLYVVRQVGYDVVSVFSGFSELSSQDYQASQACLKVCDMMSWTPYHYVEVLVDFYYRKGMRALRYQYELQEKMINDPYKCISWYYNFKDVYKYLKSDYSGYDLRSVRCYDMVVWFLQSFGFERPVSFNYAAYLSSCDNHFYEEEVESIVVNADKSKKVNSLSGLSPHIV